MALSMDEQRILAEIERRLSADDPVLATRLSSFSRPRLATAIRTPRGRMLVSLLTLALVALMAVTMYATIPFRSHAARTLSGRPTAAPAHPATALITGAGTGTPIVSARNAAPGSTASQRAPATPGGGSSSTAPQSGH